MKNIGTLVSRKDFCSFLRSLCACWKYLTRCLKKCGLPQSPFDHCVFVRKKVIEICYAYDLIFLETNEKDIIDLTTQLH